MKNTHEHIVNGETAKKMIEELQRNPTKEEIEQLQKAIKNRIPRKSSADQKRPTPS